MKRHEALVEYSREHQQALQLGLLAKRAAESGDVVQMQAVIKQCEQAFEQSFEPHFQQEEKELLPRLLEAGEHDLVARVQEEHQILRLLQQQLPHWNITQLKNFSTTMMAHVRFEEREVFPRYEKLFLN